MSEELLIKKEGEDKFALIVELFNEILNYSTKCWINKRNIELLSEILNYSAKY